jgi:hypothetical protein
MTGEIYAAVFGKGEEFVLIPFPTDVRAVAIAVANGLGFAGVMGFIRGECHAKCEPNEAAVSTMMSAAPAFALYVEDKHALT